MTLLIILKELFLLYPLIRFLNLYIKSGIRSYPHPPAPPFQTYFLGSRSNPSLIDQIELFGKLQIKLKKDVLIKNLNIIEPRLNNIEPVTVTGNTLLHGEIGMGRLIPFPIMGGGMVRLTNLILYLTNAPKGVVLIDEIENGLHHSVMKNVWKAIGEISREFDTQVFATTHSFECIVSAHKAFSENNIYDFRLHRLEREEDHIRLVNYDQESLEAAIDMGLEVR
jgi:AAA15 family ATPase/GTPase